MKWVWRMNQIYLPGWSLAKRLDHCGGVPVSQFWWAGVSNPFISFQQSPALCRVQPTRVLGSQSKNISPINTRKKTLKKSPHKYSDWITHVALRPSSDYWVMQPTRRAIKIIHEHHLQYDVDEIFQPSVQIVFHVGSFKPTGAIILTNLSKREREKFLSVIWLGKEGDSRREIDHIMRGNWSLGGETGMGKIKGWRRRCKFLMVDIKALDRIFDKRVSIIEYTLIDSSNREL